MGSLISQLPRSTVASGLSSANVEMIKAIVEEHKVVIFSKSYCPFCKLAKEQFKKISVPVHVVELDKREDGPQIQTLLGEMTGSRTVPRCFINGQCVGGGTDVKRMYDLGTLQKYFS